MLAACQKHKSLKRRVLFASMAVLTLFWYTSEYLKIETLSSDWTPAELDFLHFSANIADRFLSRAVDYAVRVRRPFFMGELSLELRLDLERVQTIVDRLCQDGVLVQLGIEDLRASGYRIDAVVYRHSLLRAQMR